MPLPAIARPRPLAFLAATCFAAGFAAMQVYVHRDALVALTLQSYEARQKAMTSTMAGPDRYYVLHEPGISLAAATADPAVLTVEPTTLDGLTGVDIAPGNPSSIEAIRALDGVRYAILSRIPLFCH